MRPGGVYQVFSFRKVWTMGKGKGAKTEKTGLNLGLRDYGIRGICNGKTRGDGLRENGNPV